MLNSAVELIFLLKMLLIYSCEATNLCDYTGEGNFSGELAGRTPVHVLSDNNFFGSEAGGASQNQRNECDF